MHSVYCADMAAAVSVANINLSQDWRVNDSIENVLEIFEESLVEKDWLEMGVTSGENREYLEKMKSENWRRFDAARAKFEGEPRKFLNHLSENFERHCHRRPERPLNIWRKISRKE